MSKTIAGIMGPTVLAIGIAVLLNISALPALAEQIAHDAALVFLSGILLLVAGLAIVRVHNRWQGGWPVVVTILGWVCLISGLARLLLPTQLARIAGSAVQNWLRSAHSCLSKPMASDSVSSSPATTPRSLPTFEGQHKDNTGYTACFHCS